MTDYTPRMEATAREKDHHEKLTDACNAFFAGGSSDPSGLKVAIAAGRYALNTNQAKGFPSEKLAGLLIFAEGLVSSHEEKINPQPKPVMTRNSDSSRSWGF